MIESVLHFFKIHRKVVLGNPAVIIQNMFGKTPKSFDAVNVIFCSFIDQCFRVVHGVMFSKSFERIVAPERIGVVDRTLSRFLADDAHKLFFAHMLDNPCVHPSIALQKAENNAFTLRSTSTLSLASAAEVRLVEFNLAREFLALQFCHMIDRLAQLLVHSCDRLVVEGKIVRETIRRLLFIETSDDCNFFLQLLQRFLFSTSLVPASDISPRRSAHSERSTENALSSSQKVGRTAENVISSLCHMDILSPYGYYSP